MNWIQIQRRCKRRLPLALPLSTSLQTVRGDLGWRSAIQHLVQCAALFCTYSDAVTKAALARVTLARMSVALAVQMNGFGSML